MSVLAAHDLSKAFGPKLILDGVSLAIEEGERIGLVGLNGSGKTTLARILAGMEGPDAGGLTRRREADVGYLAQDPMLSPEDTPRSVVLSGLRGWTAAKLRHDTASEALAVGAGETAALLSELEEAAAAVERLGGWERMHQVEAVLGHVGLRDPDAKVSTLSGGDRRRVALARILVAQPALAVLDEPTNHLDTDTIEWLERYLVEEFAGALVLITHDRYLLDRVAQRTLELHRGKLYSYDGGYEAYLEAKAERLALEQRTEDNRKNFLRRELEWLRRQPKARTGKQKARIDRAEAARSIAAPKAERAARLSMDAARAGKTILELRGLTLSLGGRTLVPPLDFTMSTGERVGIVGKNGVGKTTLLRAIVGELTASAGEIVRGANTRIAYFDQLRATLDESASVFDEVAAGRGRVEVGGVPIEVRSYLERFLFEPSQQRQPIGSLSGGERARVALAKMLSQSANLVLLDEPTNDLDVATLGALEEMLVEFAGAALVVTHDRWFLDRVATSILVFEPDGRVVRHAGNYRDYRERQAEEALREASAADPVPSVAPARAAPANRVKPAGLSFAERRELEALVDKVEEAEERVRALERMLADPELYATRGGEVAGFVTELERARADAASLMARWEELETKRGA